MQNQTFEQTLDEISSFIKLKQQNLIIYAWMQIKKIERRYRAVASSRNSSLNKSYQHCNNTQYSRYNQNERPLERIFSHQYQKTPYVPRFKNFPSTTKQAEQRQKNNFSNYEYNHAQTSKHQLTEKYSEDDLDELDQQQFQDIVLDKLDKLQQTVCYLLKEKKNKLQNKSNVTPSTPYFDSKKFKSQMDYPQEHSQKNKSRVSQRKKSFFDGLRNIRQSPQKDNETPELTKLEFQKCQTEKSFSSKGQNKWQDQNFLRYIPLNKDPEKNINKIKRLVEKKSPTNEKQFLIDLNTEKKDFNKWNTMFRTYQNSKRNQKIEGEKGQVIDSKSQRSKKSSIKQKLMRTNQIYYVPKHIECQSAIEPFTRKKYSRNNMGIDSKIQNIGNHIQEFDNSYEIVKINLKDSSYSSKSHNPNYSTKLNNRTTIY